MKDVQPLLVAAAWLLAAALSAASASAAPANEPGPARALNDRLQQDLAQCRSGRSAQATADCRREAYAAHQSARREGVGAAAQPYAENALKRCQALEGNERAACIARMQGQGSVRGSVESGGIYRELVTVTPAPAASAPDVTAPR